MTPDTVHTIFANIAKLVNFSRRFLTALETEYEPMVEKGGASWIEGRWGYPFVTYVCHAEEPSGFFACERSLKYLVVP